VKRLGRGRRRRRLFRRPRLRLRLRLTGRPRGEQRERIHISVRVGSQANAEMDVGLCPLGVTARADRADDFALFDRRPRPHADRPHVDERDRVAVGGANRQTQALVRELPDEGGDAGCGRTDVGAGRRRDVDSAVLAAGVGIPFGGERPQHRPFDGPRPGSRRRAQDESEQDPRREDEQSVVGFGNHERALYRADRLLSNSATATRGTACFERLP
jgi:hypothetical protein